MLAIRCCDRLRLQAEKGTLAQEGPDDSEHLHNKTPLWCALQHEKKETVRYLLLHGADRTQAVHNAQRVVRNHGSLPNSMAYKLQILMWWGRPFWTKNEHSDHPPALRDVVQAVYYVATNGAEKYARGFPPLELWLLILQFLKGADFMPAISLEGYKGDEYMRRLHGGQREPDTDDEHSDSSLDDDDDDDDDSDDDSVMDFGVG